MNWGSQGIRVPENEMGICTEGYIHNKLRIEHVHSRRDTLCTYVGV